MQGEEEADEEMERNTGLQELGSQMAGLGGEPCTSTHEGCSCTCDASLSRGFSLEADQ